MSRLKSFVAATLLVFNSSSYADSFHDLASSKAPALSVGALSLLNILNSRPEVQLGLIQTLFAFAEPNGTVWLSAWPGPRASGQTPAERCTFVLKTLHDVLGADTSGTITPSLRRNVETIVLASTGTASSDETIKGLADQMTLRGIVPLSDHVGTCQQKILNSNVVFLPRDDVIWGRPQ